MAVETTAMDSAPMADKPLSPPPVAADDTNKPSSDEKPATTTTTTTTVAAEIAKDEGILVADIEAKSLAELKQLLQTALANHELSPPPPPPAAPPADAPNLEETPAVELPTAAVDPPAVVEEKAVVAVDPPSVVEEKAVVDDDGAKTVEAIEETVISVSAPATTEENKETAAETAAPEVMSIWGVPLLGDERSDTVLLKFLRARDFVAKDALTMIKNAVAWRREFGIEALLEEDLGVPKMERAVFMHGVDREGHPVCYNVYGEFQDKELYASAFGNAEKSNRFLRWRIQVLERGIRELLDFGPGGISAMVQVTDLKNSPGLLLKREFKQALQLLQDNYPEFAAKQVFINVPWWYLAFSRVISPFLTQRSKSKFVYAGPSKSAEILFKYIAPEQVPVRLGGLSNKNSKNNTDFTAADAVVEATLRPSLKQLIEISVTEASLVDLEVRVLGWDVIYGAEFVPSSEGGYTVILQKASKLLAIEEPVMKSCFRIGEPGKVVLTVENTTSNKKKLLYRYKVKSSPTKSISFPADDEKVKN